MPGWFGLGDVLDGHVRTRGGQVALVSGEQLLTWAEVAARADALAGLIGAHGVDRVLWLGQNCHRLVEALFAAARLARHRPPTAPRLAPHRRSRP